MNNSVFIKVELNKFLISSILCILSHKYRHHWSFLLKVFF